MLLQHGIRLLSFNLKTSDLFLQSFKPIETEPTKNTVLTNNVSSEKDIWLLVFHSFLNNSLSPEKQNFFLKKNNF